MTQEIGFMAGALFWAVLSAAIDYKTHKIPNRIVITSLLSGFLFRILFDGVRGGTAGLAGFSIGFICILFWLSGALKAGDVKLYMAVGAWGGWKFCLETIIFSILLGGIAAFLLMIYRKRGLQAAERIRQHILTLLLTRKFVIYEGDGQSNFCFGIFIALGAFSSLLVSLIA